MNYRTTLPADYDMEIIRNRVAAKGRLMDDFPGLGQKAYLIRERGVDGSPVNQYSSFYLWNTSEGMNSFLWGPGFQGVIDDFGRPVVEHWTGLGFVRGPEAAGTPRAAARRSQTPTAGEEPASVIAAALDALARTATRPGLHSAALLIDPRHWELVHFSLWQDTAPEAPGEERYEVLHLSRPGLDAIATGRQW
jgi:hypothetical protein